MYIGYDYFFWNEYQEKIGIDIDLKSHPSLLLTGASGSGKSYALKWILKNLLKNQVNLTFCNFKKSDDFKFLNNFDRYYSYLGCEKGLAEFFQQFKERQTEDIEFNEKFSILVFDEYPAFILSTSITDKKLSEKYKTMISEILMLGRSYGFGIWLIMQRPDAAFLANGARDNFHSTISLGNLSKEAKSMLYGGEELPNHVYNFGEGVCWVDGIGFREIKFPKISNMALLEQNILSRLTDATARERMSGGSLDLYT
ncbi:MAG: hypothetical protein J1F18_07305 [Lachnospiraceae bacterium]|nr:hypothetical protein [Lachnospiraceae bacterium]